MPRKAIPDWDDFRPAYLSLATLQRHTKEHGVEFAAEANEAEIWRNSRYQVHVVRNVPNGFHVPGVIWLSIKNVHSPRSRHDWRDLQRIKNELVGPECDAIEIYPAESRLHDAADQWHLWVFPEGAPLPIGFLERYVSESHPGPTGSQRKFDRDAKPDDLQTAEQMGARGLRVSYAGQSGRANPEDPEGTRTRQEDALRSLNSADFASLTALVEEINRKRGEAPPEG